jgi:D-tyrosyl-tRNA(Tyr) deacylase
MRALIQRVSSASVTIDGRCCAQIEKGYLVFLGISVHDTLEEAQWLCGKIAQLRVMADEQGLMNKSLLEVGGDLLLVSQFTLHASTKKGNRPSFIEAARPEQAIPLYEAVIAQLCQHLGKPIQTGEFGADMQVALVNDGPVSIWIDSLHRE